MGAPVAVELGAGGRGELVRVAVWRLGNGRYRRRWRSEDGGRMSEEIIAHPAVELEAAGQEALAVAVLEQVELAVELAALIAEQEGEHRVLEPLEREVVEAPLAELGTTASIR
jgi:hypothetical protein